MFYHQLRTTTDNIEEDLTTVNLMDSIRQTQQALHNAYSGFEDALEDDLIDSYIYEINALQKKYKYLVERYCPATELSLEILPADRFLPPQLSRPKKHVFRRNVSTP